MLESSQQTPTNQCLLASSSSEPSAAYLLPLRRWFADELGDLPSYLAELPDDIDVIVADGSADQIFNEHARRLPIRVSHIRVQITGGAVNGKAAAVVTAMRAIALERIVIADDDVRYDNDSLRAVLCALDSADVIRPQNFFSPMPWHAAWDSSRSLVNRVLGGDWPGTLAINRSAYLRAGGYATDVLFENFELVRAVRKSGGRERLANNIFVRRLPASLARFREQRVRQAYDEFARPGRLAFFLALWPAAAVTFAFWGPGPVILASVTAIMIAETGRRQAAGVRYFPPVASLFAPLWVLERATCSWIAVWHRVRYGGIAYAGVVLRRAAD